MSVFSSVRRTALFGLAMVLLTGAAPKPAIDGVWRLDPGQGPGFGTGGANPRAPLTPEAQGIYAKRQAALQQGDYGVDPTSDCLPIGFPRVMAARFPFQVVTEDDKVTFIFEDNVRAQRIFLNAKHDPDIDPAFNGDSIGRWEGDALVVDVQNFKDGVWLDANGVPQTSGLKIAERIRLINGGKTLEVTMTATDPKTFTRPWTARKTYSRVPDTVLGDVFCPLLKVDPRWASHPPMPAG